MKIMSNLQVNFLHFFFAYDRFLVFSSTSFSILKLNLVLEVAGLKIKFHITRKKMAIIMPVLILMMVLAIVGLKISENIPAFNPAKLEVDKTTYVYDKGGNVIAALHGEQNRVPIPLNEVPISLKNAFIATEDTRFYEHHGVDLKAIIRASVVNVKHGDKTEGGSTITQQLVKNTFLSPERTFKRKLQEAYLAIKMERQYTKEEILEMYLNRIYFGHGAYGIQIAAQKYFGKQAVDLTLAESAMLAGIPRNPSIYSPYLNMASAKKRQAVVLDLMVKANFITVSAAEKAKLEPLKLAGLKTAEDIKYIDFVDYIIEEAESKYGLPAARIYKGGLKIYTSLDAKMQTSAEEVYVNDKFFPTGKPDQMVQSGMVLLDPHSGEIKAMMGGRKQSVQRGLNRAVDPVGQPGSTFKPIVVYGPAVEMKISPNTVLIDEPINIGGYAPKNADGAFRGPITMRQAIAGSVNVFAVKLLNKIGVEQGFNFAKKLGFELDINDKYLSLALGGTYKGVSPIQMATAFGAFDNKGILMESHGINKITDFNDRGLFIAKSNGQQVMSEQTAQVMTELLEGVVKGGTGTNASMNRPVAGKTGTTELDEKRFGAIKGNKDTWFVGYTPELVAAVWVGYDKTDREHYLNSYGGNYPAIIWKTIMSKVLEGLPVKNFEYNKDYKAFSYKFSEKPAAPPVKPEQPKNITPPPPKELAPPEANEGA